LFALVLFFDFGLSQLTSLQFILYHEAEFYTPTIPKSTLPFAGLQHMKQCKSFSQILFQALIQLNGA
jgi:hypothetical protein